MKDNAKDFSADSDHTLYYSYVYRNEKLPVNADNRTTVNADNRTTVNADNRTTVNADNRTTVNADNRTTINADNRLFGNLSLFFDQLLRFKNIETEWNVSGFSKKVEGSEEVILESLKNIGEVIQIESPPEKGG